MRCFLFVGLATVFVGLAPAANLIWVANGVLLAYLLLAPRWRWPAYVITGFAAQQAGGILINHHWQMNLLLGALNILEVLIGALLLRRRSTQLPLFTDRAYLIRFLGFAVLAGPLATGAIYAAIAAICWQAAPFHEWLNWTVADSLGAVITTPACVAIFRTRLRNSVNWKRDWVYPTILAATAIAAFCQTKVPLLFLIYPLLILVLLRLGLGWAALSSLFVAAAGSWFTLRGVGPFATESSYTLAGPAVVLQLYIASGIFMLYAVSVVLEQQRTSEHRLQEIATLHALVTDNSRDAILIADLEGRPGYVSSAMERMVGWSPDEMRTQGGARALVHPDDLPDVEGLVTQLQTGKGNAMTEYRIRKRDGEYLWVEANLKLLVDPVTRAATGTLNSIRDISERKRAEKLLQEAYDTVEALSVTDALTGLANRRQFDQYLTDEWRRAMREHNPLSLLMIDVDLFKSYNDTYGHQRGDSCLKQIAESAMDVVTRSGDLVARFGGEEFAIILPSTDNIGALRVANEICEALRHRSLPHVGSPFGIVTISAGVATMMAAMGLHASDLIGIADEALYQAKRSGRNKVCNGSAMQAKIDPGFGHGQ